MILAARYSAWMKRRGVVPLLIVALWAIAVFPNLSVRSFIWEEGTNAENARDILVHGNLLQPDVYGTRWSEKPSLLPLLVAGVAKVTGEVTEFSARLPAMLAVVITALLVQSLTRRYASPAASLLASLSFMFSPMLLQKLAISEPDTLVTLLSFAAFVLWWDGAEKGRVAIWRWIGCGVLLAVLAMAKGPQPVGYFALGVSAYLLVMRRWRDGPGLLICLLIPAAATVGWAAAVYRPGDETAWIGYARLYAVPHITDYLAQNVWVFLSIVVELWPATLLAFLLLWRATRGKPTTAVPSVVLPLVLYGGICTIAVVLWPGSNSRYAMPCAPAVAVLAGLAWDGIAGTAYAILRLLVALLIGALAAFQILFSSVAVPLYADRFGGSRIAGQSIGRVIREQIPAPVFATELATNQLFYVRFPIQRIGINDLASISAPAWLVLPREQIPLLAHLSSKVSASVAVETESGSQLSAVRLEPR